MNQLIKLIKNQKINKSLRKVLCHANDLNEDGNEVEYFLNEQQIDILL